MRNFTSAEPTFQQRVQVSILCHYNGISKVIHLHTFFLAIFGKVYNDFYRY